MSHFVHSQQAGGTTVAPVSSPLRVRRYDLGSALYQALLRDYLRVRLSLDYTKAVDNAAADDIIRAADGRFAYVSFLAERRETGEASAQQVATLAKGDGLYRLWLSNLDREYGRKQAEAIRQVLAVLAAAEEAHAFVFGAGRKLDPATGGALTPLPEQFEGLEIGLLARLLDLDRPHAATYDRIDPALLFTLQTLQGVLWVSRAGAGATRFRLALKEFLPAAKADPVVGPMLRLMQERIAARALDAADRTLARDDGTGEAWALLEPLAPLVEAAVHLCGAAPISQRWQPPSLVSLFAAHERALEHRGHAIARVPWLTLIAALVLPSPDVELTIDKRNHLAAALQHRGNAKRDDSDLTGAIADYNAAIALRKAIRDELGDAWRVPLPNDLAAVLQNRGHAKSIGGDFAGAIADFDAAIALMEAIREALGAAWPVPLRNDLANSLQSRGNAKRDDSDLAGAIADYNAAIALMEAIRDALGPAWPLPLHIDLATALQNRGVTKSGGGDVAGAIADYDAAVALMDTIRDAPGAAWLRNHLAAVLQNRGHCKCDRGDLAGAIADFGAAIALREAIRDALGAAWPVPLRNNLAGSLGSRGAAKRAGGDLAGAIADYNAAIVLRAAIRDALGAAWPVPLRNDLAGSLQSRGLAKSDGGDLAGAIADYDAAIALMEAIRDAPDAAWPASLRNDLATVLLSRGAAKRANGDVAGAIADFDAAIALMEAIRDALGAAWPVPLRNDLANSLQHRGIARSDGGDVAGAIADFDAAIALMEAIRRGVGMALWNSNLAWANTLQTAQNNRQIALDRTPSPSRAAREARKAHNDANGWFARVMNWFGRTR